MTKTKLYLNKIANLFKKNNSEQAVLKQPSRKSIRSKTSNKIYPEMIDEPLYTVDDEDEDRYDIDMFDQEIMMENRIKTKSREEKKHLYEKVLHLIKHEEEDYVYQNNNDSEEENEENDKKFKLIDSGLMYEKELEKVSNAEAFYSLFAEKKNAFEMNRMYSDSYPCLDLRKKLMYVKWYILFLSLF